MHLHLFIACFLLCLLTGSVMLLLLKRRIADMRGGVTDPRYFKTYNIETTIPKATRQMERNYINQFEMPMLFYACVAFILALDLAHLHLVILAYAYVVSRLLHAAVHLTSNKIYPRAFAFLIGFVILLTMWVRTLTLLIA